MKLKFLIVFGIITLLVVSALVVATISNAEKKDNDAKKIAVSIFPIYDITRQIAGDKIKVELILPPGASAHTYEPTANDQLKLSDVSKIFLIGHELDHWAEELAYDKDSIVTLDKNIKLHISEHNSHNSEHQEEEEQYDGEAYDPHYWTSLSNAIVIAQNITDELVALDPENKSYFENNFFKFKNSIELIKKEFTVRIESLEKKQLITFHSAFSYMAEDLGLEIVAVIEEFPGKEPSASYLQEVGKIIEQTQIRVLFKEPQLSDSIVQSIADDYGAEVLTLDPLGGLNGRDTYQKTMYYNIDTVISTLSK